VDVSTAGRGPRVNLRVEELRLDGFEPGHRHRIAHAFQRELTRLIMAKAADGELGELGSLGEAPRLDGGSFAFRDDDPPHRIGAAIARATFRGLTGGPERGPDRGG
jgi:hypothetical protein